MVNNKLLTIVLGTEVRDFKQLDDYVYYNKTTWVNGNYPTAFGDFEGRVNTDTLVRLCKEWMYEVITKSKEVIENSFLSETTVTSGKSKFLNNRHDRVMGRECGDIEYQCTVSEYKRHKSGLHLFTGDTELEAVLKATERTIEDKLKEKE